MTGYTSITAFNLRISGICGSIADDTGFGLAASGSQMEILVILDFVTRLEGTE
jgi:hypothetical protein